MNNINSQNIRQDIKHVLLFFRGTFPKPYISTNSFLLPTKIFPNAKFTIRCKDDEKTHSWIRTQSHGKYVNFISDKIDVEDIDFNEYDCLFNHDTLFNKQFINKPDSIDFREICFLIYNVNLPFYMIYCDFHVLHKVVNPKKFFPYNIFIQSLMDKTDFSNMHMILFTEVESDDLMFDMKTFNGCIRPNVTKFSANFFFNFYDKEYVYKKPLNEKSIKGGYFANFHASRATFFRKILNTHDLPKINLVMGGAGINNIKDTKYYNPNFVNKFEYSKIYDMINDCDWMLYIGRCKEVIGLGSTLFLPLLQGVPVLCYTQSKNIGVSKLFSGIDCWFSNEHELHNLLNRVNLEKIYYQQIERIKAL